MVTPPWTLESLAYHWGDAYLFCYTRDRWVALRRDRRYFLTADTLDDLEAAISSDYETSPVPRAFDPPDAAGYLDEPDDRHVWEPGLANMTAGDEQYSDEALDPETRIILWELRQLFPHWEIIYSPQLRTWMAKSKHGSFCEHSIALVWVALARMEHRRIDWD